MSEKSAEELKELSLRALENPAEINNLSAEDAKQLRNYLHPYGNIITARKRFANLSVMNWRESYLRKVLTTAMVGYLSQLCDEYDESKRETIREFIKHSFEYDPNRHVRAAKVTGEKLVAEISATKTDLMDASRIKYLHQVAHASTQVLGLINDVLVATRDVFAGVASVADEHMLVIRVLASLQATRDKIASLSADWVTSGDLYADLKHALMTSYQQLVMCREKLGKIAGIVPDCAKKEIGFTESMHFLDTFISDLRGIIAPITHADTAGAVRINPPAELFHQFARYLENNYERLREIVEGAYAERPDIEFSVIFYDSFKTAEDAREHRVAHADDFRSSVFTIENNGITLLGPFKENRDRVDFYNKNTEILKRLMEQMESDHKLGKDLMEKQVKTKKAASIKEVGPDAPGLSAYTQAVSTVRDLGAKEVLTREEQEELMKARALKESAEVPKDAVQVDVYHPQVMPNGETKLARSIMYSQAEAPLHMKPNSPFSDQYQPKRELTSRTGEKKNIEDVRAETK